jgi:hypothetical protein
LGEPLDINEAYGFVFINRHIDGLARIRRSSKRAKTVIIGKTTDISPFKWSRHGGSPFSQGWGRLSTLFLTYAGYKSKLPKFSTYVNNPPMYCRENAERIMWRTENPIYLHLRVLPHHPCWLKNPRVDNISGDKKNGAISGSVCY